MSKAGKKATKVRYCAQPDCKTTAATGAFCRLHYIANWHEMKEFKKNKQEERLNRFVEKLAEKYPEEYLEKLKEGVEDSSKFMQQLTELDVDVEASAETDQEFLERFKRSLKDE